MSLRPRKMKTTSRGRARQRRDKPEKGIMVNVLRSQHDSTNNGVTSRFNRFILVDGEVTGPFEPDRKTPALKLVRRTIYGKPYVHAEPLDPVPAGHVGYMFGGNFIYTSDSRFPNRYPIPVHDRMDTKDQYRQLSI